MSTKHRPHASRQNHPPTVTEWHSLLVRDVICSERVPSRYCRTAQRVFVTGDLDL